MVRVLAVVVLVVSALAPGRAWAHPLVDQAREAYHGARHARALSLLERAEDGTELSREELIELYVLRAMIHRAQREMELAEVDLTRLAALDPEHQLGRRVHPSLRRLFDEVRERVPRVRVEASAERVGATVRVTASVTDDVSALAQGFRLHARADGGIRVDGQEMTLAVPVETHLGADYWVEAIGPGGAPIATHGTATEPVRLEPAGGATTTGGTQTQTGDGSDVTVGSGTGEDPHTPDDDGEEGIPAWPFILGAVVIAAAVGIALGVFFGTQPTNDTQLGRPVVESLVSRAPVLLTFE